MFKINDIVQVITFGHNGRVGKVVSYNGPRQVEVEIVDTLPSGKKLVGSIFVNVEEVVLA